MTDFWIRIKGDIWITVPPSPRKLTTYVLLEQEDWFEKEIRFLRRWLKPGMRCVDIGANYGVYTLTIAKSVTPSGIVYAFEPSFEPRAALSLSAAKNGFNNIELLPIAISNRQGRAAFHTYSNSELNSFTPLPDAPSDRVDVAVSTLDSESDRIGWDAIDFLKIDTEGEENRVIEGGRSFFMKQSPLVMFELPASRDPLEISRLLGHFRDLGYGVYRLVGPDSFLVPYEDGSFLDQFEINLFACKPARARSLASEGFLVDTNERPIVAPVGDGRLLFERQAYAKAFGPLKFADEPYQSALDSYAAWRDPSHAIDERYAALYRALMLSHLAAKARPTLSRVSSFARIALETGMRGRAAVAMEALTTELTGAAQPPDEPFFPPTPRFDAIPPQPSAKDWLFAAAFESSERARSHSGYFAPPAPRIWDFYAWFHQTPFNTPEMERRRQLLRVLHGKQRAPEPAAILSQDGTDNLNASYWNERPFADG